MKKTILLLILFVLVFSMYSCSPAKNNEAETENSNMADSADIVIVNNAEIYDDYAVLPLCETLTSLGFNLTWLGNDHATFVCNEVEYRISILAFLYNITNASISLQYAMCDISKSFNSFILSYRYTSPSSLSYVNNEPDAST